MRHWISRFLPRVTLLLAATLLVGPLAPAARVRGQDTAVETAAPQVSEVLERGRRLENERRWSDALLFYEDAVKQHPGERDLEFRLDVARIHVDLARRYADSSYLLCVEKLGEPEALSLFSEVLLKVHTHYVQAVEWKKLVLHGALALDIALEDATFLERNVPAARRAGIEAFRQEMRTQVNRFRIADRRDAYNSVAYFGRLAQQRLEMRPATAVFEFTCGVLGALDEYSSFLTGSQLDEVFSQIEGNFVGLGVELKAQDRSLLIVNTIPGGPADEGGIRPGDRIVEVSGRSTQDVSTDEAADMLKGEEGSQVDVVVVSADGASRALRLTRRRVDVPSVENARIVDEELGIGYMRLTSFQKTTSRDVDAALWNLHRQGMRSLILDVRGNPGGLLNASVEVADKFLTDGAIVSTRGRSSGEDYDYRAHTSGTWRLPLIVLIDGDSASASEIFAGAIRDHGRGVLVGQRSYGKGSVQGIFPLQKSLAGVRLTTAKFYSPSGQAISQRGVHPDIVVHQVARPADGRPVSDTADSALRAALDAARQQLARR